jgi:iron complex outermembrane receptor protein
MNYFGYNYTNKDTDFDYLRLRSDLGDGWRTDNTLYTYAYNNQTISTNDPTWTGTTVLAGQTLTKDPRTLVAGVPSVMPGIDKQNKYRVWGDLFKATKQLDSGLARVGLWYESSSSDRHQYDINVLNMAYNKIESTPPNLTASVAALTTLPNSDRPISSVKFDQQSTIKSVQPFAEYEWELSPSTVVTPGLKYVSITRAQTSPVAQTTRIANDAGSLTYSMTLPFLTVNQKLDANTSVYAQYAQGFQIPDLKTMYVANPSLVSTDPQRSTNYQLGIVSRSDRMTWDADIYRIDFTNKLVSNGLKGADAGFLNIGGATYQGVEGQMTYLVGGGLAAYINGSLNRATANDTGMQISGAPEYTAALGALYNDGGWSGSLIYKHNGPIRQVEFSAGKAQINGVDPFDYYQTAAYGTLDLALAYTFSEPIAFSKKMKLQLNVFNVADSSAVTAISTGTNTSYDTYIYQTPRSFQVTVKADF